MVMTEQDRADWLSGKLHDIANAIYPIIMNRDALQPIIGIGGVVAIDTLQRTVAYLQSILQSRRAC